MAGPILVVDDDAGACWALDQALRSQGYVVQVANGAAAALRHCRARVPALVITDVRMPGGSGLDLLSDIKRQWPDVPVVVMTAYGSIDAASSAVARGASDYLTKPLDLQRTLAVVERHVGARAIAIEVAPGAAVDTTLIGDTPLMQDIFRRVALAAASDLPLLISGPTGSGKELAARLVHKHSARNTGPCVIVNCGTLQAAGSDRELFGVVDARGGISPGLFAAAQGGVLILDDIGDMPASLQSTLVRVFDDHQIRPVGSAELQSIQVRIIAITQRDLSTDAGFRQDVFHRLSGMTLTMPALLEHRADIPLLISHLLSRLATRLARPLSLTEAALQALQGHDWPGNVREMRQRLEEAAATVPSGIIDEEHLRLPSTGTKPDYQGIDLRAQAERILNEAPGQAHARWQDHMDAPIIIAALSRTRGNQLRPAELLGMHRATLRKRTQELGLTVQKNIDGGQ